MADRLAGRRILVIEDEYFIASDVQRALTAAGAQVLGPTGDVPRGLQLADGPIEAAVLDVHLNGSNAFPIADALAERGVPFVFVTGYDDWALPERHRTVPRLNKPFRIEAMVDRVVQLVEERG